MTTHVRTHPPRPRHPSERPPSPAARRRARLRRTLRLARTIVVAALLVWGVVWGAGAVRELRVDRPPTPHLVAHPSELPDEADGIKIGTFLGNEQRRFYGKGPVPEKLDIIWKARIGSGWTNRKEDDKPVLWAGAGWTGQPALVRDKGKLSLVIGGYDHRLHRYDAATGDTIWEYDFGDVIKSSPTVFANPRPTGRYDKILVAAGSRRGFDKDIGDDGIASFRAVSFANGHEVWRLPVPRTANYSRDVDASALLLDGGLYQPVEPGYLYKLDPSKTKPWGGDKQPVVVKRSRTLWDPRDVRGHGGEPGGSNLAIEASPSYSEGLLFVNAGSGHVYGLSPEDLTVKWDFKTGSDIDGTPVVRRDGKLFVPIERQYVDHGGVYLLDPTKKPEEAVAWWFPTQDRGTSEWAGGVVGSVGINDDYDADGTRPPLAAFNSVDGFMYVVSQEELAPGNAQGPRGEKLRTPKLVFSADIGGGISTPILVDDYIVTTGYDRKVHVYRLDYRARQPKGAEGVWLDSRDGHRWFTTVREVGTFEAGGPFEATPIVWKGRIYVACRDGYLYCLGDKKQAAVEMDSSRTGGD